MVYIGANRIIEACKPVVHKTFLRDALDGDPWAGAWRVTGLSEPQRRIVCKTAEGLIGTPYDTMGAVQSALPASAQPYSPKCFCSGIVAASYAAVGIQLTEGGANPGALANYETRNPLIHWLGWIKHPERTDCDIREMTAP